MQVDDGIAFQTIPVPELIYFAVKGIGKDPENEYSALGGKLLGEKFVGYPCL